MCSIPLAVQHSGHRACYTAKRGASNNSRLSLPSLPGQLISTVDLVKNPEVWFLRSDPGRGVTGCCTGPSRWLAGGVWCRSPCCCCSWAIVAVVVGMRRLRLRGGQCFCLAAGSLSLRILPAFLGQASPPLLSANAGTARSRARLHRNLSTPLQGEAALSHPSHTNRHRPGPSLRAGDGTCTALWSPFPLRHFGSAAPTYPSGAGRRQQAQRRAGSSPTLAAWPCVLQWRLQSAAKEEAEELSGPSPVSSPVGSSTSNTEGTDPQWQCRRHRFPLPHRAAPSQRTLPFPAAPAGPLQLSPQTQTISISCSNISNK